MNVNLRSIRSFPATGKNQAGASNSKSKKYDFKSPTGEIFRGRGVRDFAQKYGLNEECLYLVLSGKAIAHKGWTKAQGGRKKKIYIYHFLDPNGNYHKTSQLGDFARTNGLDRKSFHALTTGVLITYKGWKACNANQNLISTPVKRGKSFILLSPDGQIIKGFNISEFARVRGLIPGCLINLLRGARKTYKGWSVPDDVDLNHHQDEDELPTIDQSIQLTISFEISPEIKPSKLPKTKEKYTRTCDKKVIDSPVQLSLF
ncbi:hypothetical protein [Nostoc sp. TCL26-01]|uniref:hypothetical protein n=1 Tax=Nostoc sp. TCL26-01 TaxID=2576904 RepID=UPI0015BE9F55|nr:hypothetical protein [Nostoc sp. TCL26-01]QLE59619.1 hypothetical protein FD725_29625 [Nostoc sp. TCL26-01]